MSQFPQCSMHVAVATILVIKPGFHLVSKIWGGSTINEWAYLHARFLKTRISLIPPDCFGYFLINNNVNCLIW